MSKLQDKAFDLKTQAEFLEQSGDMSGALEKYRAALNHMYRFAQTGLKDADADFRAATYHNIGKLSMHSRKYGAAKRWLNRALGLDANIGLKNEIGVLLDSIPETEQIKSLSMRNWFECKVKYEKVSETSGKTEKVTEPYLIDAMTFGEAEERIYKSLEEKITGEFEVKSIARANISDVFEYESGEWWFKCKVSYVDVDEESGKDKKVNNYMLITADTAREAYDRIQESLKEMVVPYEIPGVNCSPIIDIFPYNVASELHGLIQEGQKMEISGAGKTVTIEK